MDANNYTLDNSLSKIQWIPTKLTEYNSTFIDSVIYIFLIIVIELLYCSENSDEQMYIIRVSMYYDRLCGLVVRITGYRYRGPGFDFRRYQIF
jgi:hypothetical protein